MIDRSKFQIDVLKDMLGTNPRMKRVEISDDEVGLTDGYRILVFQKKELKIKWEDMPVLQYRIPDKNENTEQIFDSHVRKHIPGSKVLAKLCSKDKKIVSLVDQKLLQPFLGCGLFSQGGNSVVLAYDGIGTLVGLVLPVRGEEF